MPLRSHIYRDTDRGKWDRTQISNSQDSSPNYVISCPVRLHHTTSPKKVWPSRSVPGTEVYRLQHNSESFAPDSEDLRFSPSTHDTCSCYRQSFRIVQRTVCRACPSLGVTVVARIKSALSRTAPCAERPMLQTFAVIFIDSRGFH
jgi:hypothetical protein